MSELRNQLRLMIPRLAKEANQLRDQEARSRWMKLRAIGESPKSVLKPVDRRVALSIFSINGSIA